MSTGKLNLKFKSVKSLEEQLQEAKAENEQLKESNSKKRKNLDAFKKIVEELEKEIEELKEENKDLHQGYLDLERDADYDAQDRHTNIYHECRAEFEELKEQLEDKIEELKERLADESSPKRVGWWENRCGEKELQIWTLQKRNNRIIELLTEDQVEELMRLDAEDSDPYKESDSEDE